MTETILSPLARKNLTLCLERTGAAARESVDLSRACAILAAAGLRVVDETVIEARPAILQAVVTIASAAMANPNTMQTLVWED